MNRNLSRQPMWLNLKAVSNDCFAYGVLTDHRADWALATYYQQPDKNSETIQRNPG